MNKFTILILLFLLGSCKNINSKKNIIDDAYPDTTHVERNVSVNFKKFYDSIPEITFPFSNIDMNQYIIFEDYDMSDDAPTKIDLIYKNLSNPIAKENSFMSKFKRFAYIKTKRGSNEFKDEVRYEKGNYFYPINKFLKDSIFLITFVYQDFEDIMPAIKTQLNSYDQKGDLIDTLILDNRFSFELIYKNDFIIKNDFSIKITENIISYYDEMDNLIPKETPPKVSKITKLYYIDDNGMFKIKE